MRLLKSFLISVAVIASAFVPAMAQLTAEQAFVNAPTAIFPLLDRNTRLDMIDYCKSGSSTASQNVFQGSSRVTSVTPESLHIEMTGASTYDIIILPQGNNSIIAMIQTVATPAPDSHLTFYDASWNELKGLFNEPSLEDWLTAQGKKDVDQVKNVVPFMLASYTFNTADNILTLKNNLEQFLSEDIYSMIESDLNPTLRYKWNGKNMSPLK